MNRSSRDPQRSPGPYRPRLAPQQRLPTRPGRHADIQPVVFYDQGAIVARTAGASRAYESASSIGAGLRWNWQRRLDLAAEVATVLNGVSDLGGTSPASQSGHTKLYLSLFYRF